MTDISSGREGANAVTDSAPGESGNASRFTDSTPLFTPGPWAVDPELADFDFGATQKDGSRAQLCRYVHAPESGGGRIAQCFANCLVTTTPELEANARLIAAAPQLYEAVRRLMPKPFTGNPTHEELVQFWTYEQSQGRGEAEDVLFALAALKTASPANGRDGLTANGLTSEDGEAKPASNGSNGKEGKAADPYGY